MPRHHRNHDSATGLFAPPASARGEGNAGRYVRVAVETGISVWSRDEALVYSAAEGPPLLGRRVVVPVGRTGKSAGGVVVAEGGAELLGGLDRERVRPILRETEATLPEDLLDLAEWIASYYVCPLGMVLAAMLPGAVKQRKPAPPPPVVRIHPPGAEAAVKLPRKAAQAWAAALAISPEELPMPLREFLSRTGLGSRRALAVLEKKGLVSLEAPDPATVTAHRAADDDRPALEPQQRAVLDGIAATPGGFRVHLLHGVTGSGKTEVYLHLLEKALAGGKTGLVLVPEIALTPQTTGRFIQRFGEHQVAALHSGLTPARRAREWERARSGEARIVVGARSAVFAPLSDLGVIIVDEEHDASYKQDQAPRYHARDASIIRGRNAVCPVVLGSATPSLETWSNATGPGAKFSLWSLPERAAGARPPEIRITDMREERRERYRQDPTSRARQLLLGPTLENAVRETLRKGRQAMLLINRRGFAHHLVCTDPRCGYVHQCDRCDANMVLHKSDLLPAGGLVRCHHCLTELKVPTLCPLCGKRLNPFGGGTQRLEEELEQAFADLDIRRGATLLRLDSDSMRSSAEYFNALERFRAGDVRILIGTQMIAKGHDFPNVALVGVVDADSGLAIPDFRAYERTYQLIAQVAGRAGRADVPGLAIVQTSNPQNPAIVAAARGDFAGFAGAELAIRAGAGLPPVTRMARIVCRDGARPKALEAAQAMHRTLEEAARDVAGVRIVGPAPCAIERIDGKWRFGIELFAPGATGVQKVLGAARQAGLLKSDARTAVDTDPVALM